MSSCFKFKLKLLSLVTFGECKIFGSSRLLFRKYPDKDITIFTCPHSSRHSAYAFVVFIKNIITVCTMYAPVVLLLTYLLLFANRLTSRCTTHFLFRLMVLVVILYLRVNACNKYWHFKIFAFEWWWCARWLRNRRWDWRTRSIAKTSQIVEMFQNRL